jgi:hypothetical protein
MPISHKDQDLTVQSMLSAIGATVTNDTRLPRDTDVSINWSTHEVHFKAAGADEVRLVIHDHAANSTVVDSDMSIIAAANIVRGLAEIGLRAESRSRR